MAAKKEKQAQNVGKSVRMSSGIKKKLKAIRHAKHQAKEPYYSRCGFHTRTGYRQFKRAERMSGLEA